MSGESKQDHRRFLRNAAVTIAGAELGTIGFASAQSDKKPSGPNGEPKLSQADTVAYASEAQAVRPFRANVPEAALADLRRRIATTRWPDRETVTDESQGVRLATILELACYWGTAYSWRKCEAKLNALPQFMTQIDGLDIHFIYVRSKHENAVPLIVTHGWPGSVIEQLKIIDPLTNPTTRGASASDAFHLVIPSIPGYGFSSRPTTTGWDPARMARAWVVLMKRLGYPRFVAQGGDVGGIITNAMAAQAPGVARHAHQLPRCPSTGNREGDRGRRAAAGQSLSG